MELRSLVDLAAGECGRVQRIAAGANATKRLYEMGFNTGAQVRVMKNDFGPLIVARGLAEKMLVKKLERV